MLKCPHCGEPIQDKVVLSRCAQIANKALMKDKDPDYFRQLQAKRKKRSGGTRGGRPPAKRKQTK